MSSEEKRLDKKIRKLIKRLNETEQRKTWLDLVPQIIEGLMPAVGEVLRRQQDKLHCSERIDSEKENVWLVLASWDDLNKLSIRASHYRYRKPESSEFEEGGVYFPFSPNGQRPKPRTGKYILEFSRLLASGVEVLNFQSGGRREPMDVVVDFDRRLPH